MRLTYLLSLFVMCEARSLYRNASTKCGDVDSWGRSLWPEVGEVMVGLMRQPFNVTVPAEWPTNIVQTRTRRR
jgi:hypothetical protein